MAARSFHDRFVWALLVLAVACSAKSELAPAQVDAGSASNGGPTADAEAPEASSGPNTDIGKCASKFGSALTPDFGRIDGTLVAIVRPQDRNCPWPNDDHVVVQVAMNGGVYRMVVNVQSDRGTDQRVRMRTLIAPLPAPAWEEGWHTGVGLDYVALGAHSTGDFEPLELDALVSRIVGEVRIGDPVSVYATSSEGRTEGAHLVHRNDGRVDGAIVVAPNTSSPKFLLFHFATQAF